MPVVRKSQYHKEGRALRTETTINDAYDFELGRRLSHLSALRKVGFHANRRLLDVQRISHDCAIGEAAFARVSRPVTVEGQRAAALRFADPLVLALLELARRSFACCPTAGVTATSARTWRRCSGCPGSARAA